MSRSLAAISPQAPRKAINAFRSAWGPASSVQKRWYCPLDRRVIASELEAIAAPPLLDVLPSLGVLVGIESDVSHGAPPA